jgi:hypothetical protein
VLLIKATQQLAERRSANKPAKAFPRGLPVTEGLPEEPANAI